MHPVASTYQYQSNTLCLNRTNDSASVTQLLDNSKHRLRQSAGSGIAALLKHKNVAQATALAVMALSFVTMSHDVCAYLSAL